MIYIIQNIVAILAGTVAGFSFGALWYSVLGKPWMAAAGLTEEMIKGPSGKASPMPFIIAFGAEFWMASILAGALILAPVDAGVWAITIITPIILWIGFVMPAMLVNNRYEMRPLSLFAINAGHWLGVLVIQAVAIRLVGVSPPTS
ncbi:MAG: DUF1761 domain-containing protein [Pseudomonadota bacterium]